MKTFQYSLIICLFILISVLIVSPLAMDDAFIIFNYARNLLEGNGLAYDSRGIPSEGVTSLLYTFVFAIFNFFIDNPFNVTFVLNIISAIITAFLVENIFNNLLKKENVIMFFGLPLFIFILDTNLKGLMGLGLESIFSIMFFVALIKFYLDNILYGKSIIYAFIISFLLFNIRPESAFIILPIHIHFLFIENKTKISKKVISYIFLLISVGIFLYSKYLYFNDIFPTSYYRKVTNPSASIFQGIREILSFIKIYGILLIIIFYNLIVNRSKKYLNTILVLIFITVIFQLLFFSIANPIIRIHFRFEIYTIYMGYFCLILTLAQWEKLNTKWTNTIIALTLLLALGYDAFNEPQKGKSYMDYAQEDYNNHPYIKIGKFLTEKLGNNRPTLMMPDAGAVPYITRYNFIDFNGLSEPYIAKLFKEKEDKVEKLITYLDNQKIDLFIGPYRNNGLFYSPAHGCLSHDEWIIFSNEYLKKKYTLHKRIKVKGFPYDLVFYVNNESEMIKELIQSVKSLDEIKF